MGTVTPSKDCAHSHTTCCNDDNHAAEYRYANAVGALKGEPQWQ